MKGDLGTESTAPASVSGREQRIVFDDVMLSLAVNRVV